MPESANSTLAHAQVGFFLRLLVGGWFFIRGWHMVLTMGGLGERAAKTHYADPLAGSGLPTWMAWAAGYADAWISLVCGGLVLLGFLVRFSSWLLMLVIVVGAAAHQIQNPMSALPANTLAIAIGLVGLAWVAGPRDYITADYIVRSATNRIRGG
ncbi:MAG: DoxX family membrane protein [Phycisphaerales bacterium]|nr:MAG: DoxX family membrane protein [Phycisphaerales bacterium]